MESRSKNRILTGLPWLVTLAAVAVSSLLLSHYRPAVNQKWEIPRLCRGTAKV